MTVFGLVVHPLCPYLDFEVSVILVLYSYVEGLVAVGLGIRQPVAKTLGVRLVFFGHV